MFPPVDYPLDASNDDALDAAEFTYATLLDRYDSEQPITNAMILQACQKMDEAQQFPFAPIKAVSDDFPGNSSKATAAISNSTTRSTTPTTTPITTPKITASNALLGRLKSIIR